MHLSMFLGPVLVYILKCGMMNFTGWQSWGWQRIDGESEEDD